MRLPSTSRTRVHTDIGNHCVAAKIDRRLVPLRTPLRNGQTVEIITAKGATPNPAWVNFVVTAKARAAIRHYLKGLKHSEAVELGKRLLNQALRDLSLALKKIPDERLQAAAAELNLKSPEELFEKIGLGERLAPLVARRLLPPDADAPAEPVSQAGPLAIAGTEGMVVSYARCCFPIPNDPIMAYLSSGRGVVIHREACGNLRNYRKQPDKWLSVTWQPSVDRLFNVEIRIDVTQSHGRARRDRLEHRHDRDQHRARRGRRARRRCLDADLRSAGARPQAPRQRDQESAQDAGSAARHAQCSRDRALTAVAAAGQSAAIDVAAAVHSVHSHCPLSSARDLAMPRTIISTAQCPEGRRHLLASRESAARPCTSPGQIPLDPATGELVQGPIGRADPPRVRQSQGDRRRGGRRLLAVAKLNVFLTDLGNFAR